MFASITFRSNFRRFSQWRPVPATHKKTEHLLQITFDHLIKLAKRFLEGNMVKMAEDMFSPDSCNTLIIDIESGLVYGFADRTATRASRLLSRSETALLFFFRIVKKRTRLR